jgi:tripeptidyl-peptidase-1
MFLLNTLSAALAISSSAVALSIPTVAERSTNDATSKSSIYEKLSGPPAGWVRDDSTTINKDISTVKLRIQLMEQNMNKFHELAMNVCLTFFPFPKP